MKQFCKGTFGFGGSLFLRLQVLAAGSFHSSALLAPLPPVSWWRRFWRCAGHPLQAVLGTSCLIPPQPFWCCAAFSPPPAAQPPAVSPFPGFTFQALPSSSPFNTSLGVLATARVDVAPKWYCTWIILSSQSIDLKIKIFHWQWSGAAAEQNFVLSHAWQLGVEKQRGELEMIVP